MARAARRTNSRTNASMRGQVFMGHRGQVFMGHRSISNTTVYTAIADKRIRNIRQTAR
jgi:hypothetical protein